MATVYLVTNTANTQTITVQPGTLNGPLGVLSDTDVNLPGTGALQWGNKLDENFLRLAENFACPESVSSPGDPQDANDLGPGFGINNPIEGQQWFNTTNKVLQVFDGTGWKQAGGTSFGAAAPTTSPSDGDLWYDTGDGQLKIWDGSAWESVADRYVLLDGTAAMTGQLTLVGDPVAADDAARKQYVDDEITALTALVSGNFLPLDSGLTPENMISPIYFDGGAGQVTSKDGYGNLNLKAGSGFGAATGHTDNNRFFETGSGAAKVTLNYEGQNGSVTLNAADIGTFDGVITYDTLTWSSSGLDVDSKRITSVLDPVAAQDAATKDYVDVATAAIPVVPGGANLTVTYGSLVGTNNPGDVAVTGGKIYVALGTGDWKQVWPAVYS